MLEQLCAMLEQYGGSIPIFCLELMIKLFFVLRLSADS